MNSTEKQLVNIINKVLPKAVKEIEGVISRPYWESINVGEAFERIFSGFCNDAGFSNDCEGKKGNVVDIYFHQPATLVQVKTTHPLTKNPKGSFQFCRTAKCLSVDEAILDVRKKFFRSFSTHAARSFYLIYHDFKHGVTILYLLATKSSGVTFHGDFLNGKHGSMSKDYLMVPKADLKKVWEKAW